MFSRGEPLNLAVKEGGRLLAGFGALGFMGHPHLIQTPIEEGSFVYYPSDPGKSSVEVVVDASALQVLDPKRSAKERQEIS